MSEFAWPPPDNELELNGTLAPPEVRRALTRRPRGVSRPDKRQRQPEHDQSGSFVWPPGEADLTAPASVEAREPAVDRSPRERAVSLHGEVWIGPDEVRLDRGPASPPLDQTASTSWGLAGWRIAIDPRSRRFAVLAAALFLACLVGGIWQMAGRQNTASQLAHSSHSSVPDPRRAAEDIAGAPLSTQRPADRAPGASRSEPKEAASRTATEREPDAPTAPAATAAAAPEAEEEREERPTPRVASRSPAERPSEAPSEAVVASAAMGGRLELTPLVERLPPPNPRTAAAETAPPIARSKPDASGPVPTAASASVSPTAESGAAPVLEDHEAIEQLVARYQAAFDERDADAAAAVWPSVDAPALARAFADVQEQDLTLDSCDVAVEEEQATASCPGALSYVRRVGPSDPEVARHVWTFLLERHEQGWMIAEVSAR